MPKNKNKKIRLVVDVDAWVSSLLSLSFYERLKIVFDSKYLLVVSTRLFSELDQAVSKPHLSRRIVWADYMDLVSQLRTDAELVDVSSTVDVCSDPKDNFLLALAKDGNADYLITGDNDLRTMKEFEKTKIVSLSDFEAAVH